MSIFFSNKYGTTRFGSETTIFFNDNSPPNIISDIFPATGDIQGTSVTGSNTYTNYVFTNTGNPYIMNLTNKGPININILAVAGGGGSAGGQQSGGGGGGGGVVMSQITLPEGTNTVTISVGAGGIGVGLGPQFNGENTTITFSNASSYNITAYGGGSAGGYNNDPAPKSGGSGGGCLWNNSAGGGVIPGIGGTSYGNVGYSGFYTGGGGGAGATATIAAGGNGIQCTLPGIATFSPYGTAYSNYYWAGGGGCFGYSTNGTSGGLGGGGGGGSWGATPGTGGGQAFPGKVAGYASGKAGLGGQGVGANGAQNSGGGGGGGYSASDPTNNYSNGGSGIVIFSIQQVFAPPILSTTNLVPTPDILWVKFNYGTLINDPRNPSNVPSSTVATSIANYATSGITNNLNFWGINNGSYTGTPPTGSTSSILFTSGNYKFMFTSPVLTLPSSATLGNGYTICFWIYIVSSGANGARIFTLSNAGNTVGSTDASIDGFTMYTIGGSTTIPLQQTGATSGYTDTTSYSLNTWTHVAFTSTVAIVNSSAANSATSAYYINSVAKSGFTSTNCNAYLQTATSYNIGLFNNGVSGYMSDLRVYGRRLSSTDINTIYSAGRPTS